MTALHEPAVLADASRLTVPLLRPADAAELLSVRLPCLRVGRHIRFTREMLEAWLAAQGGSELST